LQKECTRKSLNNDVTEAFIDTLVCDSVGLNGLRELMNKFEALGTCEYDKKEGKNKTPADRVADRQPSHCQDEYKL
jgi:hypothetical protein